MSIKFDADKKAIINPIDTAKHDPDFPKNKVLPKLLVSCFSTMLFNKLLEAVPHKYLYKMKNASQDFPVYEITYKKMKILASQAAVGAPVCVGNFEEITSVGVENVIMFGTCGVLNKEISYNSIIIPTSAYREEGTSYHYLPDSDEIEMDKKFIPAFKKYLNKHKISFTTGKAWTTDAFFRETKNKVEDFKNKGVIAVDMEASAMAAVAKFRKKHILHFFYAADSLDAETWDERSLGCDKLLEEKAKIWLIVLDFVHENRELFGV